MTQQMPWPDDLNAEQRAAATAGDGPVAIIAGPGTGKTKTLTARIAYLVAGGHAQPEQILAVTFTKKAAEEMRSRVTALLAVAGHAGASPTVATFHAVCHELLGGEQAFITDNQRLRIIKQLAKPAAYKGVSARELGLLISRCKNQAEDDPELQNITVAYDAALAGQDVMDFDDLLVRAKQLLQTDDAVRSAIQQRYRYILVDEFQDTNLLQYELLQLLLGHTNVFVIGDPNQSIYGFRGASGTIFGQFKADHPQHTAVTLTVNYRSTPAVVAVGNAIFPDAPQLQAYRTDTGTVQAVEVLNEYSEANWVLDTIQRAVGGGDFLHAVSDNRRADERSLSDFAILYRNRAAASACQKAIAASGLPYQIAGEGTPYDHPQVQALVAVLRSYEDATQPPPEGITPVAWQAALAAIRATGHTAPHAIVQKAIQVLGYEITPDVQQFVGMLVRFKAAGAAVRHIDALAEQSFYDPAADAITLLTIHASKGLEFAHVFVVGAEEGILPHATTTAAVSEERRLFYVAATRARQNLEVLYTRRRGGADAGPSRFITGLPGTVLPRTTDPDLAADQRRAYKRAAKRSQQSLF